MGRPNEAVVGARRQLGADRLCGGGPARSQLRLRPILLTTATTIGGRLPLRFGGGAMFEPMAIALIFGMLLSTALSLEVVPVLSSIFFPAASPSRENPNRASRRDSG